MRIRKRVGTGALCAVLTVGLMAEGATPVLADSTSDTQSQLDEKNQEIDQIKQNQSNLESDLAGYQSDLQTVSDQLTDIENQISDKQQQISDLESQIQQAESDKEAKEQAVKERAQYVYENKNESVLETLLESKSLGDLLTRAEYINAVYKYDKDIINQYEDSCEQLADLKDQLTEENQNLADLQEESEDKQTQLQASISDTQSDLEVSDDELQQALSDASALEEQLKAENEAAMEAKAEEMMNYSSGDMVAVQVPYEETVTETVEVPADEADSTGTGSSSTGSTSSTTGSSSTGSTTTSTGNTGSTTGGTGSATQGSTGTTSQGSASSSSTGKTTSSSAASSASSSSGQKTVTKTITKTVTKYRTVYEQAQSSGGYPYNDNSGRTYSASQSERELLAAIIYCEAGGESYAGQQAVGSVIMNRVYSSSFPNTITGVVYQSGQFEPVSSGRLSLVLSHHLYSATSMQAANAVLSGNLNVKYWFFYSASYWRGNYAMKIGNQIFF